MANALQDPRIESFDSTPPDRPARRKRFSSQSLTETFGAAVSAFLLVWFVFRIFDITGPLGFAVSVMAAFFVMYGILVAHLHGVLVAKDRLATFAIWTGALSAAIPLVAVILYVIIKGGSVVLADFPHFFFADFSHYTASAPVTAVGAGAAIVGTVEQVGLATIYTVPLGVLTATYLVNHRNTFATLVSNVVDAMSGMPAIVAGLFIYLIWVEPRKTAGLTGFSASLALGIMMLPIVTRTAQEVIAIVPGSLKEASLALGAPEWRTTLRVILPTARIGLVTAVILGVARVAGETAPVLFTAGGNSRYNFNPFVGQQDDLPLRVYEMIFQPGINATRMAWGVAFVLVLVVLGLFVLARVIGSRTPGRSRLFRTPFQRHLAPDPLAEDLYSTPNQEILDPMGLSFPIPES
jgi:phosphate transport system permease protein